MIGETEAAGREREAVLAGNTVQLGADHKDTLYSKRALAFHHKQHLGDVAAGVAMLREVVAACARNPELGREYQHPGMRQSFAAELAEWEAYLVRVEAGELNPRSPWTKYVNGERIFWLHGKSATLQEPAEGARPSADGRDSSMAGGRSVDPG